MNDEERWEIKRSRFPLDFENKKFNIYISISIPNNLDPRVVASEADSFIEYIIEKYEKNKTNKNWLEWIKSRIQ